MRLLRTPRMNTLSRRSSIVLGCGGDLIAMSGIVVGEKTQDLAADIEVAQDKVVGVTLHEILHAPDDQCVQRPRRGETVRHHDAHELHQHDRQPRQRPHHQPHHQPQELARARGVAAQQRLLGARIEEGVRSSPSAIQGSGAVAGVCPALRCRCGMSALLSRSYYQGQSGHRPAALDLKYYKR
jgi:hypothetical protein